MGVLKVNVGTPSVPDWRTVGCGGDAAAAASSFATAPYSWTTLPNPSNTPWTLHSTAASEPTQLGVGTSYIDSGGVPGGGVGAVARSGSSGGYDFVAGGGAAIPAGATLTQVRVWSGTGAGVGTIIAQWDGPTTGTTGRLKLWDGTQWVRERCTTDVTEVYPTAANTVAVYDRGDGTLAALANQLTYTATTVLDIDLGGATFYFDYVSGSTSGHSLFTSSNTNGGGAVRGGGATVGYSGFGYAIFCRDSGLNYLGNASPNPSTVTGQPVARPLYMWDGSAWVTVACMVPA